MSGRLFEAIENNARWCDLVCRSHGIPTQISRAAWAARRRAPQLYPDAISLLPDAPAEEVLKPVEAGLGCSVKDSFASMDLERFGFDELFEAHWIYREPARRSERSSVAWSIVESEDAFAEWVHVAGLEHTIGSDLLRDSAVRFLSAHGPDGVGAGAIASRTGSVVGVSNVFSVSIDIDETWATLADAFARAFPSLALVGYEHGESLAAALASGFTTVGPLRVWLRTTEDEALADPSLSASSRSEGSPSTTTGTGPSAGISVTTPEGVTPNSSPRASS